MTLALVTGASRGIGRATALALARRGCSLALVGRRSPNLASVTQALESEGARVAVFHCDLAESQQIQAAMARLEEELGTPDVLVNNAGIAERGAVIEMTPERFDAHLAVNLRAPFLLARAVLPGMLRRGSGRIINVASISSTLGSPRQSAYNASKWGLVGFVKSLAEELRDTGLMTVAVLPGSVDTDMLRGSGFPPRMAAAEVALTLVHYGLDAPLAHNGGIIEMFGV
jgi:3-oxoacyl-[acyl-carrier protein] reductase